MSLRFGARAGTLASAFSAVAVERGDALALADGDRRWSFARVDAAARVLAAGLAGEGVGHGDRVAVIARNRLEHAVWLLASTRLGAIHTAVHPEWTEPEIRRVLADAQPSLVAAEHRVVDVVTAAADGQVPVVDLDGSELLDRLHADEPLDSDAAQPGDACALWYTSGTSGRPKGVVWTHTAFLFNALAINDAVGIGSADIGLRTSPMSHNGISSAVIGTMLRGAGVHLMARFKPAEVVELIRREQVTWTNLVPAAGELLLRAATELGVDTLPSLRRVLVGAAPTPPSLLERLTRFLPRAAIVHGYGATEGYIAVCRPEATSRIDGSVGQALEGVDVKIVDPDGHTVAPGTNGRLLFRSPGTLAEYWRNAEATAAAIDADGWVDIGDIGCMDEHGSIWVKGRESDVINTGGYMVYASEVEAVLDAEPRVAAAAVVGVPDDVLGMRVEAFVEPVPGATITVDDLSAVCGAALARYKRPVAIHIVDALPRNSYGKLHKLALGGAPS